MSKIIKNSSNEKVLESLYQDLIFLPSPPHRRAKSKFWSRHMDLDTGSPVNLAQALQITGEPQLSRWWSLPGFLDWFLNKDEAKERLEYLWYLGMDTIESIFLDPDANHNAKVQAFKIIAQLGGKEPVKSEKYADAQIQSMDQAKLKEYILKNLPKIEAETGEDKPNDNSIEGDGGNPGAET